MLHNREFALPALLISTGIFVSALAAAPMLHLADSPWDNYRPDVVADSPWDSGGDGGGGGHGTVLAFGELLG